MTTRIKVRGLYTTALTKLLLDEGYLVVQPSTEIAVRFHISSAGDQYDILLQEKEDLQGVELVGEPERICQLVTFLQERLIDPILMECIPMQENEALVTAKVEFPGAAKSILDQIRLSVLPTIERHHRLRITDSSTLEPVELELTKYPEKRKELEERAFFETILQPVEKSGVVRLDHIRPSGKAMRPREGALVDLKGDKIAFRRSFSGGRYDGLDLDIQKGDYGLTELQEGAWYVKHTYYTREGKLIGEYFNINTPVELYPYGARYVDLEIDVVRRSGREAILIDREKLSLLSRKGCIGSALEQKAIEVAEGILHNMRSVSYEVPAQ